jgi:hypothetical protein
MILEQLKAAGIEPTPENIAKFVRSAGYDGLCSEMCCCGFDDEAGLAPCGEPNDDCQMAKKTACDGCNGCDFCFTPDGTCVGGAIGESMQ